MTGRAAAFTISRRISRRGCVGIIDAAASLSMAGDIAWTVGENVEGRSPRDLASRLETLRRSGGVLTLPADAGRWFPLSFAVAEARYALGFQLVWGLSVVSREERTATSEANIVEVVMWWLTTAMPPDCETDLRRARRALSVACQSVESR